MPRRHHNDHARKRFRHRAFCKSLVLASIIGSTLAWSAVAWNNGSYGATEIQSARLRLQNPRVVVLKSAARLFLFDGETLVRIYPVKLGPEPEGPKRRAGDGRTPEGRFRICTKNINSPNHRFLGIDYPDRDTADRGLREGLISGGEAAAICRAHDMGQGPSWTTALGGAIGLHGAADALERTAGCIALRDEHVAEIFKVLRIGDEVEILP